MYSKMRTGSVIVVPAARPAEIGLRGSAPAPSGVERTHNSRRHDDQAPTRRPTLPSGQSVRGLPLPIVEREHAW